MKAGNMRRLLSGGLAALLALTSGSVTAFAAGDVKVTPPEIMVTEIVADTTNVSGADGYEFIELYNPSQTETRNLKDYTIIYYNGTRDYTWTLEQLAESEITLAPGKTLTIWVRNETVASALTIDQFRSFYHLSADAKIATITASGMRNSATETADGCGIRVQKGDVELVRAYYNENGQSQVETNKAFTFGYNADGSTVARMLSSAADPTPGAVDPDALMPSAPDPEPEEPETPTAPTAPLLITEVVPNSKNAVSGVDTYEYFEIYNASDKTVSLDDYEIVYVNGGKETVWAPKDTGIKIAAGSVLVVWTIDRDNAAAITDDQFKADKGHSEWVRGTDFTEVDCGGMANSGTRGLYIRVKLTGQKLTEVSYTASSSGEGKINEDEAITFSSIGQQATYDATPTPGTLSDGQTVSSPYNFVKGPAPAPSAATVQNANVPWHVEALVPETGLLLNATLYVKGDTASEYTAYPMDYSNGQVSYDLPYSVTSEYSSFGWYVAFDYGVNTEQSAEKTVTVLASDLDTSGLPALLITELLPNSSNMGGSDAYEFVEVYNNSNQTINLRDYCLYYNNNLAAGANDVLWASFDQDVELESGKCVVFWIHNGANDSLTVEDFNHKFGTSLEENKDIFILENGGMSNSAPRGMRITTNVRDEIDYVTYNVDENDANGDTHADKSITYCYDGMKSVKTSNTADPTPGTIPTDLTPVHAQLTVPANEPSVTDNTPATFDNDEGLTFSVTATAEETTIKTVKLSIKDAKMGAFETYNLTREGTDDTFRLSLGAEDLMAKSKYTYYFTVSDGFNTVATGQKTTTSNKVSQEGIRFNVTEGQWLSGTNRIITTGDTLVIGGRPVTDTIPSIENKAKIIFEASQTDTFFKNAVAIGTDVLGIFNDGTYGDWKTYAYDVDPAYFTKGRTITIDIHAGNKSNPLVHDVENNDDFVVRNIRLVLPDGTTLRATDYEVELGADMAAGNGVKSTRNYGATEEIKMGDSATTVEILHITFAPADSSFNGIAYNLDTTKLSDGALTITGKLDGQEERSVTAQIDNTPPSISTNLVEGKQYKGSQQIVASISDAGSGVASRAVTLDGKKITLPYDFSSAEMTAGEHTLTITAADNCGNTATKTVTFTTPEEGAAITATTPEDGAAMSTVPTFSATVIDPTNDAMTVSFKKGERYTLGDSNIVQSAGISNTSGSNTNDFTDAASGDGFPFQQFAITVGETVTASDELNVQWTGTTNNAKTFLYVYNTASGKWDLVKSKTTGNDDGTVTLNGTVSLADHLSGQTVQVMVQNGEGYTPTQYAEGAAAGTPAYSGITTSNANDTPRDQYDFTFAVESDTQYYNEDRGAQGDGDPAPIGQYQYQLDIHDWLLANRSRMNIQYLFHNGDIIDDVGLDGEWKNANAAYKLLDDAGFPYGVLAGNHDVGHLSGDYTNYWQYFGASRYENNPWYGGSYQNNRAHYDLITVDGIDFLMMYVGWGVGDAEIEWMNEVLAQYPERIAILNFHEYLLASGGLGEEPQRVYDEVIAVNPNVRMVLSGHYHNAQTVTYAFDDDGDNQTDRKVYAMLFDYQGLTEGGMGYMRLMHFDCNSKTMTVRTYSPSLDDYDAKDYSGISSGGIVGAEEFTISFADLGIEPKAKTLTTSGLTVNVYGGETIGSVDNVASGDTASYRWTGAENGTFGWYVEAADAFGGLTRSDVGYLTLSGLSAGTGSGGSGTSKPTVPTEPVEPEEPDVPQSTLPFTDVAQGSWYYDGVQYAYENGLMTGTGADVFAPNSTVTRGMIVTILHRLEGSPAAEASGFADVEEGAWYQVAVDWAAANGIVNGTSQTTFAPNSPITREQMAAILYRYAQYKGCDVSGTASLAGYTDAASISSYAAVPMGWANQTGLITGTSATTLTPKGSATRAQAAVILMRFCQEVVK